MTDLVKGCGPDSDKFVVRYDRDNIALWSERTLAPQFAADAAKGLANIWFDQNHPNFTYRDQQSALPISTAIAKLTPPRPHQQPACLANVIAALPDTYEPVSFHVLAWPKDQPDITGFAPTSAFIHPVLMWTGDDQIGLPFRMVEALMHPDDHALLMMIVAAQPDASMSAPGWPVVMTYDLWCRVMQGGGM